MEGEEKQREGTGGWMGKEGTTGLIHVPLQIINSLWVFDSEHDWCAMESHGPILPRWSQTSLFQCMLGHVTSS